jgi:hemerythrin-like domain-containing protein
MNVAGRQHDGTSSPTAMLRQEHEMILRALALLESAADRFARGDQVNRLVLDWLLDFFSMFVDQCHHGKEEQHLFPALERCGIPREGGPVGCMLAEHNEGRRLLREMRQGESRARAGVMRQFSSLLRSHIDKENTILFPLADQVLADEQQQRLLSAFEAVEHHIAGPGVHERLWAELAHLEGSASGAG